MKTLVVASCAVLIGLGSASALAQNNLGELIDMEARSCRRKNRSLRLAGQT